MRRRSTLIAVTAPVLGLAAAVTMLLTTHTTDATTAASGSTFTVKRGTVSSTASAAGTVQAAATRGLSFAISGTVTAVSVKAGDMVTAGQVLATISNSEAQSAVDSAQTTVDSAETTLANVQASASATPSTGACKDAAAGPAASGPAATTCAGTGNNGPRSNGGTDTLFSAQQQLNNANLALKQAQQHLAGTVIAAPTAGRVVSVSGTVGSTETPGGTGFIVLNGLNDTEVSASFTESDVAHLAVGQATAITLPDRSGQTYAGKVSQVSPVATASGELMRYSVSISFDDPPTDLLYGQSADVVVTTNSAADVLYIPSTAVTDIRDGNGTVTVRAAGHEEQRSVTIGLRTDQYTAIASGLREGEIVMTSG
jgi:multidrug efflux pump subunit AcrA (membrane-fusion protein)